MVVPTGTQRANIISRLQNSGPAKGPSSCEMVAREIQTCNISPRRNIGELLIRPPVNLTSYNEFYRCSRASKRFVSSTA